MAQISRPFQIALAAIVLFALVWMVALRGHHKATEGSGSPAPSASHPAGSPSSVYHGSAPGVEGLSRAVAKAHGTVSTSEQNAKQLQERSAQASGETQGAATASTAAPKPSSPAHPAPAAASKPSAARSTPRTKTTHAPAPSSARPGTAGGAAKSAAPSMQAKVEAELKQGKIVTILFWNPSATDDRAVDSQLRSVGRRLRARVAVHSALASQVGSFGTIIRGVKVFGTPTVMIINKNKQALTLTGYTDAYAIEQAIGEARHV